MMKLGTLLISIILTGYLNTANASIQLAYESPKSSSDASRQVINWTGDVNTIWQQLQRFSSARLTAMQQAEHNDEQEAWFKLALINKQHSADINALTNALQDWQIRFPSHPGNHLLPSTITLLSLNLQETTKQIAVLLPLHGTFGKFGQRIREGFLNAYYANLLQTNKQIIKFYDTSQAKNVIPLYNKAVDEGADIIVGPLTKKEVEQLKQLGSFKVPTLALNYLENRDSHTSNNFYEFGLRPEDETIQMAYRAQDAGLSKAIIITPNSEWGKHISEIFLAHWRTTGGGVQDIYYYKEHANFAEDIAQLMQIDTKEDKELMHEANDKDILADQRRQDFDVIFLFAQPTKARLIVPMLRYNYVGNIPIYAISTVLSAKPNPEKDADLAGLLVCDIPWNQANLKKTNSNDRLHALGQDAYLLSQSLKRLQDLPDFSIYGATGALTISSNHLIHRSVPCHAIKASSS